MGSVTVFGGSGFLGRHLVPRLARAGWQIRVAVRRPDQALYLKPAGDVGQITPFSANIRERASVEAAVDGADLVINLVGILYESGPQRFETVQAKGPGLIAEAAKAAGAQRLIHVSSIGAGPDAPSQYGRAKAAGESAARAAFPDVTIFRPSIMFGPEDGFFNRFAHMAMISPALPLIGGGRTKFQPVYVGDVAAAIMAAIDQPESKGKTYELGGPRVATFKELLQMMLDEIGRDRWLVPIPFPIAILQGSVLQFLPVPPLTADQVRSLTVDNVVGANAPGLQSLGITPTPMEAILPTYLDRYRKRGYYHRA